MGVGRLAEDRTARLRRADLTYDAVGATATGPPPGFRSFERTVRLAREDLDGAARDLFAWRVHAASGLRVRASGVPLRTGTVVELRLGPPRIGLLAPCRVVDVLDDQDRRGFAYGTLPGHPESGEERFVLERRGDGLWFTITAFSRPASRLALVAGPVARGVQDVMTSRYLRAPDRLGRRRRRSGSD